MSEWFLKEAEKFLDEARECGVNAFTHHRRGADASQEFYGHPDGNL